LSAGHLPRRPRALVPGPRAGPRPAALALAGPAAVATPTRYSGRLAESPWLARHPRVSVPAGNPAAALRDRRGRRAALSVLRPGDGAGSRPVDANRGHRDRTPGRCLYHAVRLLPGARLDCDCPWRRRARRGHPTPDADPHHGRPGPAQRE